MPKSNFLLVDLNEAKTKKLAETITSDTSRKILNHLADKEDSEASISSILNLPISTVHYHLQKLQEAGLVTVEEFHYSSRGREINHYKLANKYIIIAPQHVSGLKEKLRGILPVGLIIAGLGLVLKLWQNYSNQTELATVSSKALMESAPMAEAAAPVLQEMALQSRLSTPDLALWFLAGGIVALLLYVLITLLKEKIKR
ncbi:winged helix-turn-helix transcriptional regulator [Candidatus Woesearchaeota archaeon]|nr:winged helix-turn-helix transcriptional regulator [Candidatus Woesearchaeota archaeon]